MNLGMSFGKQFSLFYFTQCFEKPLIKAKPFSKVECRSYAAENFIYFSGMFSCNTIYKSSSRRDS